MSKIPFNKIPFNKKRLAARAKLAKQLRYCLAPGTPERVREFAVMIHREYNKLLDVANGGSNAKYA